MDIESITENEAQVGEMLFAQLSGFATLYGGQVQRMQVEANRFNVLAWWGNPVVTPDPPDEKIPF